MNQDKSLYLYKSCDSDKSFIQAYSIPVCSSSAWLTPTVRFSWLTPLLHLGQKKRLDESDMYRVLAEDRSETLGEELQRYRNTNMRPLEMLIVKGVRSVNHAASRHIS